MSGIELFRVLSEQRPELANRVIFMTGDTANEDTRRFLRSTLRPALTKPFDVQSLEDLVAEQLAKGQTDGS